VLRHPLCAQGDLLGIVDQGGTPSSPRAFAASACSLAQTRGFRGILLDFQRPELAPVVSALDAQTQRCRLALWTAIELAPAAPHAVYIAETAVSGGSLSQYFTELAEQYGAQHIAAQLLRSCARFSIPSPSAEGTALTREQAEQLRQQNGASVFFSRELCAKYFTYMERGSARFVLFDDDETLRKKQVVLSSVGISRQLLLYPDAVSLGILPQ
jgi:hypothetical protein